MDFEEIYKQAKLTEAFVDDIDEVEKDDTYSRGQVSAYDKCARDLMALLRRYYTVIGDAYDMSQLIYDICKKVGTNEDGEYTWDITLKSFSE